MPIVIDVIAHLIDKRLHQMGRRRRMSAFADPYRHLAPSSSIELDAFDGTFLKLENQRRAKTEWSFRLQVKPDHIDSEFELSEAVRYLKLSSFIIGHNLSSSLPKADCTSAKPCQTSIDHFASSPSRDFMASA